MEMSQEIAVHQAYLALAVNSWVWDCHQQLLYSRAVWPSTVVRDLMTAVLLVLFDHLCWRFGRCADNARLSHCLHEVHLHEQSHIVDVPVMVISDCCQLCDSSFFTKGLLKYCLTICRLNLYCVSPTLI